MRTRDGREFAGVNVENAAYPLGVCAEKSAINGRGDRRIQAGGVRGDWDHRVALRRLPAVALRVRIPEVSFRRADGTIATWGASELLPDTWDIPE